MAPQSPTRQNSGGQEKYYRRGEIGSRQRLRTAVQGPRGAAQSTPDWQDLGLGNNRQIHKDLSWATQSNLAQHHQTGVKTIKTRPEAMQAHENSAAQPTSTMPVERTAVGKRRHVGTMQGDFPLTPLSGARVCRVQREVKYKWEEQAGAGFRGQEVAGRLLAASLWWAGLAVSGIHCSVAKTATCHVSA